LPKTATSEPDELRQAQGEVFGERKPIKSICDSPAVEGEGAGAISILKALSFDGLRIRL
jgi:hypothetical protein